MSANTILLIAGRELKSYLRSWSGYIIIAAALFLAGLCFQAFALGGPDKKSSEVLSQFLFWTGGLNAAAALFLSMRALAEERQLGTITLLYSSPVRDSEITATTCGMICPFFSTTTVSPIRTGRVNLSDCVR